MNAFILNSNKSAISRTSFTASKFLNLLIGLAVFSFLCFSNKMQAQHFTFFENDFTVVWQNSRTDWIDIDSFGYKPFGSVGPSNYQQYRLTMRYPLKNTPFWGTATAMWHNTKLNLQKDFVFQGRLFFGDFGDSGQGGDGIAFVLHKYTILPLDSLIGKEGGYLDKGLIYNALPTDNELLSDGNWHCVVIVWTRANGIDGSNGYNLETFVNGELRISRHYDSIQQLGFGNGENVTWGITANNFSGSNTIMIQYVSMKNDNNSNL